MREIGTTFIVASRQFLVRELEIILFNASKFEFPSLGQFQLLGFLYQLIVTKPVLS
jgi:hypothetical protein